MDPFSKSEGFNNSTSRTEHDCRKDPLKILLITYQGDIAGSTNSIAYLAKALSERGHTVYMAVRKESLLFQKMHDTSVKLIPMVFRSKFDWNTIKHIQRIVKQFNIQVINAQSSRDRYLTILAKLLFRLDVIIVHTRRQVSKSMGLITNTFYEKGTESIVAVSEGVKRSLVKNGMDPGHIHVVHNGTPKEKYQSIDHALTIALREKFQVCDDDFVIGCVSRRKHQQQILEAIGQLETRVTAIFVGIEVEEGFQEIINRYQVPHKVYFTGLVPCEQILSYYGLFHVKILASTMEGLSQALLEAMYLKVPVIATAAAGNLDLVEDNWNGLLFKDNDIEGLTAKITATREDPLLRSRLMVNGRKTAEIDFSIDKTASNYEDFFYSLIKNKGGGKSLPAIGLHAMN